MNPASIQRVEGHARSFSKARQQNNGARRVPRVAYYVPPPVYVHPSVLSYNNTPYAVYAVPSGYYHPLSYAPQFQVPMTYGFHNYAQTKPLQVGRSFTPSEATTIPESVPLFDEMIRNGYAEYGYDNLIPEGPSGPQNAEKYRPLDVHMPFEELFESIMEQLKESPCRVSWLNRLLAKCSTAVEFNKSLHAFKLFQTENVDPTAETGTLLIKAACRAGVPEKALVLLKDVSGYRLWPTLGGIHYLMINFSLKKDTKSVIETFEAIKIRKLKPSTRTYHILIRECVDQALIEEAMKFAEECKKRKIALNRVTYNILMNGYRKFNKPAEILKLRDQMAGENIDINDTTVKFTTLAHMMLGNTEKAVESFMAYTELDAKTEEFCDKFFEATAEDTSQQKFVLDLFEAVAAKGFNVPLSIAAKVRDLSAQTTAEQL